MFRWKHFVFFLDSINNIFWNPSVLYPLMTE